MSVADTRRWPVARIPWSLPMLRSVAPRLLVVVTLIAIASAFPALSRAQTPVAAPAPATAGERAGQEWTSYGGNLYNQRYSGLDQINTQNVKDLKGAWVYHTNVYSTGTSFESVPIVVDGVMYLTGPQSQVYALDARNGQEKWKYIPTIQDLVSLPLCCGQVNRGVAVGDGLVFVRQVDGKLTALNQDTGEVAWSVDVGDPRAGYSETMAPIYFDGMVYIGVSGANTR